MICSYSSLVFSAKSQNDVLEKKRTEVETTHDPSTVVALHLSLLLSNCRRSWITACCTMKQYQRQSRSAEEVIKAATGLVVVARRSHKIRPGK